jgi:hypothetical protein
MSYEEIEQQCGEGEETTVLLARQGNTVPRRRSSSQKKIILWGVSTLLVLAVVAMVATSWGSHLGSGTNTEYMELNVELEGKKKKKKKNDDDDDSVKPDDCQDGEYSKRTLKLAYELPFASLFRDTKKQRKYEASSVTVVGEDVYAVCDSSWAISKFSKYF